MKITLKPTPPCKKECEERSISCHGTCERYLAYKREVEEWNCNIRDYYLTEAHQKKKWQFIKDRRKK